MRTFYQTFVMLILGLMLGALVVWWQRPVSEEVPEERTVHPAAPQPESPDIRDQAHHLWDPAWGKRPIFRDISAEAGIEFLHENGITGAYHYPEVMGAGLALFDYDNDGWVDLYLVNGNKLDSELNPEITNRLFRNLGGLQFEDVTDAAGVGDWGIGQGCCVGDYDGDGDLDLYVTNFGPNVFYRNDGNGTFTDITAETGLNDPGWGQSCAFFDYDLDGDLDLYVQNYLDYNLDLVYESFVYVGEKKFRDYASPLAFPGQADRLFRNDGGNTFTDVTEESGILYPGGKGMGAATFDFDDDGWCDLFVSNDSMENYLFRNLGSGTFEECGILYGVAFDHSGKPESSMGVDIGDYNSDGRLDMIVPNIWQQIFTLYKNVNPGFEDVSWVSGLSEATGRMTGFSPSFMDYDNDGDLDLFFSTGGVKADEFASDESDFTERYGLRDLLFANDGAGRFVDVSSFAGPHFQRALVGRASAIADLDNDGKIDLAVTNLAGPLVLLHNETPDAGNWVRMELVSRDKRRNPIGTEVWVKAGEHTLRRGIWGSGSYLSQNDHRLLIGLGEKDTIDSVEILWPDGSRQKILQPASDNHVLTILEEEEAQP